MKNGRPSSVIAPQLADVPGILAIDIGTSSVRTALFDRRGRLLDGMEARRPYEMQTTPDGASQADPDFLLELVGQCLDQMTEQTQPWHRNIVAVATCTFVSNLLGVDTHNRARTPLTTYADTRASADAAQLKKDLDEDAVHDRTGCHFHPSYLPARLRWLARTQPQIFQQVARWVSMGEYLELTYFGETAVSHSVASWTGLLDRSRLIWDPELLAAIPLGPEQLSALTDAQTPRRGLLPKYAKRWPPLRDLPWFPALGDGATANLGSGCFSSRRIALTVGTSSALRVVLDQPVDHVPRGLWCYRVDRQRSLLGGALSEGGNVFAWMKSTLSVKKISPVEQSLAAMEPDAHGLTLLPFWAGERSPGWAGHARATIHGLTLATTPLDILRAGLEAVAYRIALIFDLLEPQLSTAPQVVASGGALRRSPVWLSITADVLGRPVAVSAVEEASARGAALFALETLRLLNQLEEAPDFIREVYQPNPRWRIQYQRAKERQRILYERLVKESV
jgi:gluconokinase